MGKILITEAPQINLLRTVALPGHPHGICPAMLAVAEYLHIRLRQAPCLIQLPAGGRRNILKPVLGNQRDDVIPQNACPAYGFGDLLNMGIVDPGDQDGIDLHGDPQLQNAAQTLQLVANQDFRALRPGPPLSVLAAAGAALRLNLRVLLHHFFSL